MTHLPVVDFKTMEKVLFSLGFQNTRSKGSHFFYRLVGFFAFIVDNFI